LRDDDSPTLNLSSQSRRRRTTTTTNPMFEKVGDNKRNPKP
jgi:hypothetical protein